MDDFVVRRTPQAKFSPVPALKRPGNQMTDPLRVLLVEDSENDALLVASALEQAGFNVVSQRVETRESLQQALTQHPWDLVISDYSMPRFSGTEALQLVREYRLDIPVIFVSGTIEEEIAVEAMRAGANDYMMKGNTKRLVPAVRRELADAESRRKRREAEEALRLRDKRIRALHEINVAITSTLELSSILNILLDKIEVLLPYSAAAIRLYDREKQVLEPVACRNIDREKWKLHAIQDLGDPPNTVFKKRAPVVILNVQTDCQIRDAEFYREHNLTSYIGLPLLAKEEALGTLGLYTKEEHQFSEDEKEWLNALAGQAAIAIHNAQLYQHLERSNKVKDEFLSVMSHELRTPLTVIQGYTSLIQENAFGEVNGEIRKALGTVMCRSTDLLALLTSILEITSIETGEATLFLEEVELPQFLADLQQSFSDTGNEQIALQWNCCTHLLLVNTDAAKLRHIIRNLIQNAIKFTKQGTISISADYLAKERELRFAVTDTGVGIPEDARERIFEKFAQGDSSANRRYEGAGLGLYIVKKFTELLGGRVSVQSEIEKGSCFTVTIPAEALPVAAVGKPEADHSVSHSRKKAVVG